MKKILGIILAGFAAFMLFTSVSALVVSILEGMEQLDSAVWLEDGQYDPANDGKIVSMLFDPVSLGNAVDVDFGIEFKTPAVKRYVDVFVFDEGNQEWNWDPAYNHPDLALQNRSFAGSEHAAGTLSLDPEFSKQMSLGDDIYTDLMVEETLNALDSGWSIYNNVEYTYITNAPEYCFLDEMDEDSSIDYKEFVGCVRVRYKASFENPDKMVVTGIQEGDMLAPLEDLAVTAVVTAESGDISTKEAYMATVKKSDTLLFMWAIPMAVILFVIALVLLGVIRVPGNKKKKGKKKSK